jgi:hypothetical protein
MDQTTDRQEARNDRVHAVGGIVPSTLWIALLVISAVIFLYLLFFADSGEGAVTQAVLMGSVSATITILLLLIVFFDNPYNGGVGSLQPDSMERALVIMDDAMAAEDIQVTPPCDEDGRAT